MKDNAISIRRVPGAGNAIVTATISVRLDTEDPEAVERFGRAVRELIPEDERGRFLEDWRRAAAAAGFEVGA